MYGKITQCKITPSKITQCKIMIYCLDLLIFSQEFVKTLFCRDLGFVAIYALLG